MPEIFALADRVTVLRDGNLVGTKDIVRGRREPARLHDGGPRHRQALSRQAGHRAATSSLELRNVSYRSVVRDISFKLRRGEILGLAGLVGSGRTETALTIFGITPATAGEILIDGKPVTITSPEAARDLGIAYVPEDRGSAGTDPGTDHRGQHRAGQSEAPDARLLRGCRAR